MGYTVLIESPAYQAILLHSLQYANAGGAADEVLGLCYGAVEGDQVVVQAVVMLKHGAAVSKGLTDVDEISIEDADAAQGEHSRKRVGWYRSHPGMGYYMANVDKKNQCLFQTPAAPHGVMIAVDPTRVATDTNWGVGAFQLTDIARGANSDFIEVPVDVAPPSGDLVFRNMKYIIEQFQKRERFVEEAAGTISSEFPEDDLFASGGEELEESEALLAALAALLGQRPEGALKGLCQELHRTLATIAERVSKVPEGHTESLVNMRDAVKSGTTNVVEWLAETLESHKAAMLKEFQATPQRVTRLAEAQTESLGKIAGTLRENVTKLRAEVERLRT
jgi:proteasome lid subunit RPN8/RPN11